MNKLEEFIFDILGILLPGLTILILISASLATCFLKNGNEIDVSVFNQFKFLDLSIWHLLIAFLFLGYIVGHAIKVLADRIYFVMSRLSDDLIIPLWNHMYLSINSVWNNYCQFISCTKIILLSPILRKVNSFINLVGRPVKAILRKLLDDVFVFHPPKFSPGFDSLLEQSLKTAESDGQWKSQDNKKDYMFYKYSKTIIENKGIITNANKFIAKYNSYRSLATVFLIHLLVLVITCKSAELSSHPIRMLLLIEILLWYTFHTKFKKYWTLYGNEVIVGMYYYLNIPEKEGGSE